MINAKGQRENLIAQLHSYTRCQFPTTAGNKLASIWLGHLMHFREAKLPIHLKVEQVTGEGAPELLSVTELRDSTMALIKLQEDYRAKAMQNIVRAQEQQKKQYDRKHNTNTTLNVGDKVLKENSQNKHRMGGKLDNRWTGPFIIHEDLGKGRFRVKTSAGKPLKQTIHCARLKFYHDPASGPADPPVPDPALGHRVPDLEFDQEKMRSHLLKCLTNRRLVPFPTLEKRGFRHNHFPYLDITVFCTCLMPETYDDMIQCENCEEWYHMNCVGLSAPPKDSENWYCSLCRV